MSDVGGKRYRAAVTDYLSSAAGAGTSRKTAARLASLNPWTLGMSDKPSCAQLHATRRLIESLSGEPVSTQEMRNEMG
jgi:hypothetical protein